MAASAFRFQGLTPRFYLNIHQVVRAKIDVAGRHGCMFALAIPQRTLHSGGVRLQQAQTISKEEPVVNDHRLKKVLKKQLAAYKVSTSFSERFIPITRRSAVRHMVQEKAFLQPAEQAAYDEFALRLDSAVIHRYHGLLEELKMLFDPINPDKDTITTRDLNRKQRLDNEFWLMNKLSHVMSKANFTELSRAEIETALSEHEAREGVVVSVNLDHYDILKFWVLGRDEEMPKVSTAQRVFGLFGKSKPVALKTYKRVVIAIRLKRDDKLILKVFKDVPLNALEQLLPDGKIKMTKLDNVIITSSVGLATLGLVAKLVTYLAQLYVQWTLIVTGVMTLTAVRAWTVYKNRRNAYMVDLNRMLYFKNIANNRGLLTLLVDRAEDELFKEALLVYTFLLTNRSPSVGELSSGMQSEYELGNLNRHELEQRIEDWVYQKTKTNVRFDSTDAVRLLTELGVLLVNDDTSKVGGADNLVVLPLDMAIRSLPVSNQGSLERDEESDIVEGYDKHVFDREVLEEENTRKKYGWF